MPEERQVSLSSSAALVVKAAARAAGVLAVYVAAGTVFHWVTFWIAAENIWQSFHAGPMGVHSGAVAVIFLVLILFTPQGLITAIYLFGLPALCLLLGHRQAVRAAISRLLRDKRNDLSELVVGSSMRVVERLGATSGAVRAGTVARGLRDAIDGMDASRSSRFVLRAVLRAIRLRELLSTTEFVARAKSDPEGARAELRGAIEPRLAAFGQPASFRPLLVVFAVTAIATATSAWWGALL